MEFEKAKRIWILMNEWELHTKMLQCIRNFPRKAAYPGEEEYCEEKIRQIEEKIEKE